MDWTQAATELTKKLDPSHVKSRTQGGSKVSYVEGWHAIAEANRIFGHGGWTRETVDLRCVSERDRSLTEAGKAGWRVSYVAKVRIVAGGVVREGCGAGHGIGSDLGEMHESALKEAETDAMKRALMTFGHPFGLALYDKSRENVGREEAGPPSRAQLPPPAAQDRPREAARPASPPLSEQADAKPTRDPAKIAASLIAKIGEAESMNDFDRIMGLPKFDEAWEWLVVNAPDEDRMVKQAVEAVRSRLEPPPRGDAFGQAFLGDPAPDLHGVM